eukprot:scaffold263620_cov22-Tisochrysis_lutea.AAC.2
MHNCSHTEVAKIWCSASFSIVHWGCAKEKPGEYFVVRASFDLHSLGSSIPIPGGCVLWLSEEHNINTVTAKNKGAGTHCATASPICASCVHCEENLEDALRPSAPAASVFRSVACTPVLSSLTTALALPYLHLLRVSGEAKAERGKT